MPRILCIVPNAYMGGLQIMTLRLFESLSVKFESHFLLTHWTDGEFAKRLDQLHIHYSYSWLGMFSRRLDLYNLKMSLDCLSKLPLLYRDFIHLLRTYRPDIIYIAGYREILLLLPILRIIKLPVIFHVHGVLPTATFYRFSFALWGKAVTGYLPVSLAVQASLEKLGISQDKICLLYNGIQLDNFPDREIRSTQLAERYEWCAETVIVGMTGQMMPDKGHEDFLAAAHKLHEYLPQVRFVIGGKTDGNYYKHLQDEIIRLGLDGFVIFSGWQEDMHNFYANLDIFVFPSRSVNEGFGLVIVEAMAVGVPVVVTRAGGATEVIEDQVSGILVDPHNPEQLAAAIHNLIISPNLRVQFTKEGRSRAQSVFSLAQQVEQFEKILAKAVQING